MYICLSPPVILTYVRIFIHMDFYEYIDIIAFTCKVGDNGRGLPQ